MNIKPEIYKALTPRQRIISTIDALGRNDTKEVKRLNEACEKKTYRMRDTKYSGVLDKLFELSMAVESDLRGLVIGYLESDSMKVQDIYIQHIVNTNAAWFALLDSMGIEKDSMLVAGAPRHYWINILLKKTPQPDKAAVDELLEAMKGIVTT